MDLSSSPATRVRTAVSGRMLAGLRKAIVLICALALLGAGAAMAPVAKSERIAGVTQAIVLTADARADGEENPVVSRTVHCSFHATCMAVVLPGAASTRRVARSKGWPVTRDLTAAGRTDLPPSPPPDLAA